jgi:O-antigen ligase
LYALFVALPVWWALGAGYFIWPVLTFPLFISLLMRWREVRLPRRFGIWLLFLAWMLLASIQLQTKLSMALFAYRASLYFSATVLFVYVFNLSREALPDRKVIRLLAILWSELILGGLAAVFLPTASFSTPVQMVLPASILADQTAYYFVHPALSEVMTFLGYPVGRPKTFFAYTNQWGACVAVLMPFAFAAMTQIRSLAWRRVMVGLLFISIVPIITSLNRGLWLSLGLGLLYLALRFAMRGNVRPLGIGAIAALVAAAIVIATPLSGLIHDRFTSERNSNDTRLTTYDSTLAQVRKSPLIGYGSPRPQGKGDLPHLGTQGQMFMLLYSYGVPAFAFFAGWIGASFWSTASRGSPDVRPWANASLLILLLELPYYNYMPITMHVAMVGAAIAWRDVSLRGARSQPAHDRQPAGTSIAPGGAVTVS